MGDTIVIEQPVATVLEVTGLQGPQGPTGPQGPSGEASGSLPWTSITGKPSTFTPSAHTHTSADVSDFTSAVVAAAPPTTNASLLTSGTLADARLSATVTASLGKADSASQPGHTHAVSDVTGLQTALDGKQASGSYEAAGSAASAVSTHAAKTDGSAHGISGISGLQAALDGKQASGSYAAASHTHTSFPSLRIDPANGNVGSLVVGNTTSGQVDYVTIDNKVRLRSASNSFVASLDASALAADRAISLPDASGTVMLNNIGSTAGLPVVTTTAGAITTLALGSANQVLKVNSGGTAVEFGTAAAGGTKTYAVFTATDNQPPNAAFATLDTRGTGIAVLDFDAATDENAVFVGIMPEAASLGSGLIVRLNWMATSATSGNVRWGVQFERSNTDLDADSFDTAVEATAATNGTSGIITTTAITVTTIDGIVAGDVFRLKVYRNADDATNDTMTGDAELVAVEVRSAA